jgi:hypothetical protein
VQPSEVNDLVKQFDAMAQMMTAMAGKGTDWWRRRRR